MRRFTADASHEIRKPMSILRTGLEITLRQERTVAEYRELLRENLQEIERLHAIVEGTLLLARDVPGGEARLAAHRSTWEKWSPPRPPSSRTRAAESEIRIDARVEPGLVVSGDAALLRLVVFNLLDNALKHSPKGEVLKVEARRQGDRAVLVVADRGRESGPRTANGSSRGSSAAARPPAAASAASD